MTALSAPYTLLRRDGEALLSRADPPCRALELAPATVTQAEERRHGLLRSDVARLITERNFTVAFQPVVRLSDRRPVGHEALLRLRPPQSALHRSTRLFVDAAQGWGLGTALDEAMLDVTLAAWPRIAPTPVSVNVHARSLGDPVFFARLLTRVAGEGATLSVEITGIEDADLPAVIAVVPALRGVGMRVILDDFSPSEASLACVQATRFDEVKFAGAMLGAAVGGVRGQKLLRALVALAEATGTRAVAKLIETLPQAMLMQDVGVQFGQGWLFGAPMPLPAERRGSAGAA